MTGEQLIALAMARRTAAGLGLRVYGLDGSPMDSDPFTCYAKDEAQKAAWLASFQRRGCRVEVIKQ